MKRGGRSFDHGMPEAIRLMAVERVRGGEAAFSAAASFGVSRTTVHEWLKAAPGAGLRASARATGRPRALTPRQERPGFRRVNGRGPRRCGLDFGLGRRAVAAALIERRLGVGLSVAAVGASLAKPGWRRKSRRNGPATTRPARN